MASPICSTSRLGPLVWNGRIQTLMSKSRSAWARMGARCGTRSSIGTLEMAFAGEEGGAMAQPPSPTSPPSASEFFSRYRRSMSPSPLRPIDELTPKACDLATKRRSVQRLCEAIHDELLSGNVARQIAGGKQHHVGHIPACNHAPQSRLAGIGLGHFFHRLAKRFCFGGDDSLTARTIHRAGQNGIDADAVRAEFDRECLGEAHARPFGRGIGRAAWHPR